MLRFTDREDAGPDRTRACAAPERHDVDLVLRLRSGVSDHRRAPPSFAPNDSGRVRSLRPDTAARSAEEDVEFVDLATLYDTDG